MKYKISDLAKLLDVSTNTVRRYEDMGYIRSVRDDNSGYRYYNDDAIFGILNARLMRKYEFTHEELDDMLHYSLAENIEAYELKMQELEARIAYMNDVKHRIKDDLILMRKADAGCELYEKLSVEQVYILFKENNRISNEKGRLKKVKEFLYDCPEMQRIYLMRKETLDKGGFELVPGIAIKQMDMDRCHMTENEYTKRYPQRMSVMGLARMVGDIDCYENNMDRLRDVIIGPHLQYIKEHNMHITDDAIAIVISRAWEGGQEITYMLVSVPIQ